MNLELKVEVPKIQPVVFNYKELKEGLTTALADYQNRVYTEDMIAEAKADKAKLNNLKKALSDERISRKKEFMQPFETFEDQIKELCGIIDEATSGIAQQLDVFEQKRIEEKQANVRSLFNEIISNYDLPFITFEKVFNDKWLNKSTTDKTIAKEITDICEKAVKDIEVIMKLPEYAFEAMEAYKDCLDLNKAIEEGEYMAEVFQKKNLATAYDDGECFEVCFKAKITVSQAKALSEFCRNNKIKLEKV